VSCKILDAKWLGVPQSRTRAIFVGVRDDVWRPEFQNKVHPEPSKSLVTLSDAFKGLSFTEKDKQETDLSRFKVLGLLKTLQPGETHHKAFTLVKASQHGQSPCIKATTGKIGARESYH
jgi:DNA (cytosine-5)-methyltransferase 1